MSIEIANNLKQHCPQSHIQDLETMSEFSTTVPREERVPLDASAERNEEHIDEDDDFEEVEYSAPSIWSSRNVALFKCIVAGVVLYSALLNYANHQNGRNSNTFREESSSSAPHHPRRRLTAVMGDTIPSYMNELQEDLAARNKLFDDTPPEEIKYWFEYSGPLQVSKRK